MNAQKFLTNPNRTYYFETLLMTDPNAAYTYLLAHFFFDLLFFIGSIAYIACLFIFKPESIIHYIVSSFLFIYYLRNIFSLKIYISLFVTTFLIKAKIFDFYNKGTEEDREAIVRMINAFPEQEKKIYLDAIEKL